MAITRLQQARQMYAMGQRVGGIMGSNAGSMLVTPTRDGSRPGYYGPDAGHENDPGHGSNSNMGGNNNTGGDKDARETYISTQYSNTPPATVTVGEDKFGNPINVKTTYKDKKARAKTIDALNKKGISIFDSRVAKQGINPFDPKTFTTSFAPQQKNFGILDLALMAATGGLFGGKIAGLAKGYNTLSNIGKLATDFGLTDKNVIESFTDNLTGKFSDFNKGINFGNNTKSNTKSNTNNFNQDGKGEGEGLASLESQGANYDEYILLLQKLQSGNISDAERNRYNVLKNMLGI